MPWYQVRGGVGGGGRGGGEVEELEKKKKWRRRRVLSPWQCTAGTAGKGRQHERELIMFRRRIPCLDSYLDKVNISLWPRFKMVFDMHLNSLRNANIKALWEDDVHPHYVMRRYAEFTASLVHLNVEYGDGQLDLNLERLRMAVDDLLVKLAKAFAKPKSQTVFLINNYDMTIAILKEAGTGGGKLQEHFEELLKSNIGVYVVSTQSTGQGVLTSERPVGRPRLGGFVPDQVPPMAKLVSRKVVKSFGQVLYPGAGHNKGYLYL
ncbi:hypothetical protein BHM03_00007877 [Ensete ventricosum]|nr:hypothetical protein BHM03_00007877 [Ensete ventricosum]